MENIHKLFEKKQYDKLFTYIENGLSKNDFCFLCKVATKYNAISILDYILMNHKLPTQTFSYFCKTGNESLIRRFLEKYPSTHISKQDCLDIIRSKHESTFYYIMTVSNIQPDKCFFDTACQYGTRNILDFIEKQIGSVYIDNDTITNACFSNNIGIIEYLINKGIDDHNITRIARVACLCNYIDIVKHLLKLGCKDKIAIHSSTSMYNTMPLICCQYGYVELFDILLNEFPDIDIISCFTQAHENRQRSMREYIICHLIKKNDFPTFRKCCKIVETIHFYTLCKNLVSPDNEFGKYVNDKIKQLSVFSQSEY